MGLTYQEDELLHIPGFEYHIVSSWYVIVSFLSFLDASNPPLHFCYLWLFPHGVIYLRIFLTSFTNPIVSCGRNGLLQMVLLTRDRGSVFVVFQKLKLSQ